MNVTDSNPPVGSTVPAGPPGPSTRNNTQRARNGDTHHVNRPAPRFRNRGPRRDREPRHSPEPRDLARDDSTPTVESTTPQTRQRQPSGLPSKGTQSTVLDVSQSTTIATPPASVEDRPQHVRNQSRNGGRRAQFNGRLTEPFASAPSPSFKPSQRYHAVGQKDDLTSTLTQALRTPPYPDCPICFSSIYPAQPTWSCSPSILFISSAVDDKPAEKNQSNSYCWTTFHIKCIRSWAAKSVKDISEAWRARGEERSGEWRCPGCQGKRETVPTRYWCFCGSTPEPRPSPLATPHSCANLCSRTRPCGHPCPLSCHPGPCPSCQVRVEMRCYCDRRPLSFKCSNLSGKDASGSADLSCGGLCGKNLGCGSHTCGQICHPGDCELCGVSEITKCYCGKVDREVRCGEGEEKECSLAGKDGQLEQKWIGKFSCDGICNRPFDCGVHFCSKSCHPPSPTPSPCPRSPSLVTHCPCGKQELSSSHISFFPPKTKLSRRKCSDPIPTCTSTCLKPLAECNHVCSAPCHTGPCPPCSIPLVRPCRCGATTKSVPCSSVLAGMCDEILCDRPCVVLRACGRHQCNRVCCPLAALASSTKGKGKKRSGVLDQTGISETGLHECDLICGKVLSCGNHRCEERDHRGFCPPCLRSSFDEMVCYCGRTVVEPPVPCGTQIHCIYPCNRPPPPCGHPLTQHSCHEDPSGCPHCPFLTRKTCACTKKVVENVRCSQERVSCGTACGKLLACGFHHCERLCHSDDCGPCSSPCGKSLKYCQPALHPCTLPCHAPSACPELEPCRAIVTLTCPCGRIRQFVPCGRSATNPSNRESTQQLKCSNECNIAKRNARLADALGINTENRQNGTVVYSDELVSFARVNPKLLGLVEKAFSDFIASEKRTQVLPHMPADRRKFVIDLCAVYRLDTQTIDQEPHRSIQIFRRIDTRIPTPLLSHVVASSPPPASLGKLADLRSSSAQPTMRLSRSPGPGPAPTTLAKPPASSTAATTSTAQRGWTAVVARSGTPVANSFSGSNLTSSSNTGNGSRGRTEQPSNIPTHLPIAVTEVDLKVPDNWEDDEQ